MQGKGLGTMLYRCLIELLGLQHLRGLYGCVTLPNEKSERLHRKLGFVDAGIWRASGWKAGTWHDVGWFEKRLGGAGAPEPVIAFPLLDEKKIQECLQRYTEMLNMEE